MITPVAERGLSDEDVRALCRIAAQARQRRRELEAAEPAHTGAVEAAEPAHTGARIAADVCTSREISVTLRDDTEGTTRHDH